MLVHHLAVGLALLCGLVSGQAANRWIGVVGSLSENTVAEIQSRHEVSVIENHPEFSIISCSDTSLQLQLILYRAGHTFFCESNEPIPLDAVNLREVKGQVARELSNSSGELAATVPPNLDLLDQLSNTPNGVYAPPSDAAGIKIAVLDTGIRIDNVEFEGRAFRVNAFKNEEPCTSIAHGTWVTGSIIGKVYGVAKKALAYDLKLPTGTSCAFFTCDAALALAYVLNYMDVDIVVMSWSAPQTGAIDYLLTQLANKGVVLINAAGNEASSSRPCTTSPGSSGVTYAVGSVGYTKARSSFSNYGSCIDAFGLGEDIIAAGMSSTTSLVQGDGTSIAAPQMAGVAAVLMKKYGLTTNTQVYEALATYNQKNAVVNPGAGSPNQFSNFKGSGPTPFPVSPKPAPTPKPAPSPKPTPASPSPTPAPPSGHAARFSLF